MLGFVNVFKPAGPTSTQVGVRVRRAFSKLCGEKLPVGHFGTLDPMAAGVLPLAVGRRPRA
jgi:tRNA pseudouridine55 synthase